MMLPATLHKVRTVGLDVGNVLRMDGTRIRRRALELKFKRDKNPGEGQEQPGTAAHEEEKEMWEEGRDWKLFVVRPV